MPDLKDQRWWEDYFSVGGGWERNGGRRQSRVFAEYFTCHARIDPSVSFSLLDVGCALGDAIRHFSKTFPNARLHGIDFSRTAIGRCREDSGHLATFQVGDMADVEGHYDLIYCSNCLEHFVDFGARARKLMKHGRRLCVLVPYREMKNGRPLAPDPNEHHQVTFLRDSFDFLVREGLARNISSAVFSCPGAWGWSRQEKAKQFLKNVVRRFRGKPLIEEPRQIFFDIVAD